MAVVLVQQGQAALLDGTWNTQTASTFRLFVNDSYSGQTAAQLRALTEADFTEASYTGYTAVAVSSWSIAGSGPSTATHTETTWQASAALTTPVRVHGYYITRDSDSKAMAFEVFTNGPFLLSAASEPIAFQPVIAIN